MLENIFRIVVAVQQTFYLKSMCEYLAVSNKFKNIFVYVTGDILSNKSGM